MKVGFGAFELDSARRQLRRDGREIHLTPKAFDLLVLLIENAPRVMAKSELHERLWPHGVVSDATLVGLVKEIRRALGDAGPGAPVIRTAHRVGYAFDAAIVRPPWWRNSIAVLPFDSFSSNADDAFFAAGLHDEVLTQLAKLKSLNVISRTSVLQYGRGRPSIPQIAKRLGVEAVVEGSVRYAGNQLMVTAQLIDALTDAHLWTETFRADRSNADGLFAIQTHIATAIAHALGAEITAEEQDRIERVPKHSSAAHARYLRARDEGRRTRFAAALFDLDAALELDPGFADARSWRAYIYAFGQITSNARMMLLNDARFTADTDFQSLALAEASRALELDAGSGVAWLARAVTHQFHFRVQEAREAFQRAHSLSPNDVDILAEYAGFEAQFGDPQAALVLVGRATRLDPGGPLTLYYSAIVQMAAGAADEALASLARALSLDPANPEVHVLAGLFSPDPAAAVRFIRTAEELDSAMLLPGIAQGYRRLGLEGDASRVLDRYDHWVRSGPGRAGAAEWAQYYLLRGDLALTRDWLHEAIAKLERGEADQGFYALVFSFLSQTEPWGSEPRFRELLSRLECLKSRGSIPR